MEEMSAQRICTIEGCIGTVVPMSADRTGLSRGASIQEACDGCTLNNLFFKTSTLAQESRYIASLSVALAFLLAGHVNSGYHTTLGHGIGIPALHLF